LTTNVHPHRALIIQPGALGDALLTLPLVRMLLTQADAGHVDMMGHLDYLAVLPGRSVVSNVLALEGSGLHELFTDSAAFDLPEEHPLLNLLGKYDFIVTFLADKEGHFQRNLIHATMMRRSTEVMTVQLRPGAEYSGHISRFYMEQVIAETPMLDMVIHRRAFLGPFIKLTQDDNSLGAKCLAQAGGDGSHRPVILHPGSGGADKCWPLSNYRTLAQWIRQQGNEVLFLLGPVEMERWEQAVLDDLGGEFPLLSGLTIEETAAVLGQASAYVGNDSGISHLAGALGIQGLALYGPTSPKVWSPLGGTVTALQAKTGLWPQAAEVEEALDRVMRKPG